MDGLPGYIYKKGAIEMLPKNCKILKVYIREDAVYQGHSLYHALTQRLAEMGMAGVTVTRGIEGFGREKRISSSRILDLSFHLPIIIEIIDSPEKIVEAIPEIREMMEEGLLMTTDVEVLKYGKEEIV